MLKVLAAVLQLCGLLVVVAGIAGFSVPLAFIAGGVGLAAWGTWLELKHAG